MVHEQVMVKVNAPVDRGVAPLVAALNRLEDIVTVESCEGDEQRQAYVSFHAGDSWRSLADLVHDLSVSLGSDTRLSDLFYSISIEWCAGGENPLAYLRVPRQHVSTLAEVVTSVAETGLHHDRP